jgi:hypothetical protein
MDPTTDRDSQHWFNIKTVGFTGEFATKACQRLLLLNAVTAKETDVRYTTFFLEEGVIRIR